MRAAWKGYITLGQLGIPVRLFSATQNSRPTFTSLHETDGSPVDRVLKCRAEDKEISSRDTVRAIEHEPGQYVTFTSRELEQAVPENSRAIDIKQFCLPEAIDPIHYEKPYYISSGAGGERAYALLREALTRTHHVAIAQFVIYNKEHIAAIGVRGDMLVLNQLRFAAEILPRSEVKTPPLPKPSPNEVDVLSAVIERFSGPFHVEDYHDQQTERVLELLERKIKGLPPPKSKQPEPAATDENEILPILRRTLNDDRDQLAPGD